MAGFFKQDSEFGQFRLKS